MATGISVNDAAISEFTNMKLNKTSFKFIIYKIDKDLMQVVKGNVVIVHGNRQYTNTHSSLLPPTYA
jgi:hypothetical protein